MTNEIVSRTSYKIKTSHFEGPLGLLLNLVEKRKLFINDVSLAQVTDDYLNYLNRLGQSHPEEISNFITVAATLILIKSKSLLPEFNLTPEEEGDIRALEERLRLYKIFTEVSNGVKKNFGRHIIFPAEERRMETVVFLPDSQITRERMMNFAYDVLGRVPPKIILPEVEVRKVVSVEEMIGKLTERIKNSIQFSFKDFVGKVKTREEKVVVIVSFLAMLELVRNGILSAVQDANSEEIIIEKTE
jgi:segregation and condensation protein A